MTFACPHCHRAIAQPPALTLTQSRIFNFLLSHPNTTKRQIELGVYGRPLPDSSVVISTISYISRKLPGTGYVLIRTGTVRRRYYTLAHTIAVPQSPPPAFESPNHGTDQLNRRLS